MRNIQKHAIQASQLTDEKNMSIINLKVMGMLNSSKSQLLQNKLAAQAMEVSGRQSITVQAAANV
jgi:acetylglutamate kinase